MSLVFHSNDDPQARLLAIDTLEPEGFRSLLLMHLQQRVEYEQIDAQHLTQKAYKNILCHRWDIEPSDVDHIHWSAPCESLSGASRNKETVPHFIDDKLFSPIARSHMRSLKQVVKTRDHFYAA